MFDLMELPQEAIPAETGHDRKSGVPLSDGLDMRDVQSVLADTIDIEPPRLKVLVVEDDAGDYALIERSLRFMPMYEALITSAGTIPAARFALGADTFDAVIIDFSISGERGIDLLTQIGGADGMCPVILVSSAMNAEIEWEAMFLGAAACLSKDILAPKLLETVLHQALRGHALQRALSDLRK